MQGQIISIEESAFGGDILTIQTSEGDIQSYGFINGRNGQTLMVGDVVEFETKFFEMSNKWRAIDIVMADGSNNKNVRSFLSELKALLKKYNATIEVGYDDCSDTHGVQGEHMAVSIPGLGTKKICNHWEIDHSDIKDK